VAQTGPVSSWPRGRARDGGLDEVPLPSGARGRLWLCGKHVVGPDPDGALSRTGAAVLVCLNELGELSSRYPEYVEWLRTEAGGRARWFPIPDLHVPELEGLRDLVAELRARLEAGDGVVVHCGAGIGRAGTVAAALLMSLGLDHDEALERVRTSRPGAGPQTNVQEDLLAVLARPPA
jgi:protein-tyrosine phosphatase